MSSKGRPITKSPTLTFREKEEDSAWPRELTLRKDDLPQPADHQWEGPRYLKVKLLPQSNYYSATREERNHYCGNGVHMSISPADFEKNIGRVNVVRNGKSARKNKCVEEPGRATVESGGGIWPSPDLVKTIKYPVNVFTFIFSQAYTDTFTRLWISNSYKDATHQTRTAKERPPKVGNHSVYDILQDQSGFERFLGMPGDYPEPELTDRRVFCKKFYRTETFGKHFPLLQGSVWFFSELSEKAYVPTPPPSKEKTPTPPPRDPTPPPPTPTPPPPPTPTPERTPTPPVVRDTVMQTVPEPKPPTPRKPDTYEAELQCDLLRSPPPPKITHNIRLQCDRKPEAKDAEAQADYKPPSPPPKPEVATISTQATWEPPPPPEADIRNVKVQCSLLCSPLPMTVRSMRVQCDLKPEVQSVGTQATYVPPKKKLRYAAVQCKLDKKESDTIGTQTDKPPEAKTYNTKTQTASVPEPRPPPKRCSRCTTRLPTTKVKCNYCHLPQHRHEGDPPAEDLECGCHCPHKSCCFRPLPSKIEIVRPKHACRYPLLLKDLRSEADDYRLALKDLSKETVQLRDENCDLKKTSDFLKQEIDAYRNRSVIYLKDAELDDMPADKLRTRLRKILRNYGIVVELCRKVKKEAITLEQDKIKTENELRKLKLLEADSLRHRKLIDKLEYEAETTHGYLQLIEHQEWVLQEYEQIFAQAARSTCPKQQASTVYMGATKSLFAENARLRQEWLRLANEVNKPRAEQRSGSSERSSLLKNVYKEVSKINQRELERWRKLIANEEKAKLQPGKPLDLKGLWETNDEITRLREELFLAKKDAREREDELFDKTKKWKAEKAALLKELEEARGGPPADRRFPTSFGPPPTLNPNLGSPKRTHSRRHKNRRGKLYRLSTPGPGHFLPSPPKPSDYDGSSSISAIDDPEFAELLGITAPFDRLKTRLKPDFGFLRHGGGDKRAPRSDESRRSLSPAARPAPATAQPPNPRPIPTSLSTPRRPRFSFLNDNAVPTRPPTPPRFSFLTDNAALGDSASRREPLRRAPGRQPPER